jgi:Holliday junction resolvasome RuvABC endonuclease subunit
MCARPWKSRASTCRRWPRVNEQLRARVRTALAGKEAPPWQPPGLTDFLPLRRVTAFDQSLSHTGYVTLWLEADGEICILAHGTVHPKTGARSFERSWDLTWQLARLVGEAMGTAYPGDIIVEKPLIGPGHRPESALLAGYAIHQWALAQWQQWPLSSSARHVSSVLCGNPGHDKKEIAAAVARYLPESAGRGWSEHTRDAAAMALARLYDLKRVAPPVAVK